VYLLSQYLSITSEKIISYMEINPDDGMGNEWQMAKYHMGMQANRMKAGGGEIYVADRSKYCGIQTIWLVNVGMLHRENDRATSLQYCQSFS
jgi:hypothetical protein